MHNLKKHDFQADLSIALQTSNISSFKSLLNTPSIDSSSLISQTNHNIFHDLSKSLIKDQDLKIFFEALISFFYTRHSEDALNQIKSLLDSKEIENNLTPLHIAVSTGKFALVKEYVKLGANDKLKTRKGHNLSHLASKEGSVSVLLYLKYNLNHDFVDVDESGMNCLHLAAENQNEHAVLALIAWGCEINQVDVYNNLPLHYAVRSDNYKIVRALVQGGSKIGVRNSDGNKAIDFVKDCKSSPIYKLLVKYIQKKPSCLEKINPFKHPIKPPKHTFYLFTFFVLIYLLRYLIVLWFIIPHLDSWLEIASILIFLTSTTSFMMVSQSNPGYIKKSKHDSPLTLYETFQPEFLCPFCMTKKPPGARHCAYCNKCVKKYDHHCPWIRNCVGKSNQGLFFFFVTCLNVDFLYNAVIGIIDYFFQFRVSRHQMFYTGKYLPEVALFVSFLSLCGFFIAFPVFYVQLTNRIKGVTTHERFMRKKGEDKMGNNTSSSSMPSMTMLKR